MWPGTYTVRLNLAWNGGYTKAGQYGQALGYYTCNNGLTWVSPLGAGSFQGTLNAGQTYTCSYVVTGFRPY